MPTVRVRVANLVRGEPAAYPGPRLGRVDAAACHTAVVADAGTITDEGVARLRARVGIAEPNPQPPHYRCPDTDAFRHVAEAYGDDNPLWCEPAYGADTAWGSVIAPPMFPLSAGQPVPVAWTEAEEQAMSGGGAIGPSHRVRAP